MRAELELELEMGSGCQWIIIVLNIHENFMKNYFLLY